MSPLRIAIFASHGGSNLQAIFDACQKNLIDAAPVLVVSNNSKSGAMERALQAGVTSLHISGITHPNPEQLDEAILQALNAHGVELLVLAGYVKKLGDKTVSAYRNRIINIHPSLLPKYGGKGMYGIKVHEAVLANGDTESGATVHLVDEEYDQGPIIAQTTIPVLPLDTPEALSKRVIDAEHRLYVETISRIASREIDLDDLDQVSG